MSQMTISKELKKRTGSPNTSSRLLETSMNQTEANLKLLQSSLAGLTPEEVEERQAQYGKNEVAREKPPAWYLQFLHAFLTPFNGILFFVGVISLFTDVVFVQKADQSYKTMIVISAMILLSTVLRFWQEFRSNQAAEALKAMVRTTSAVLRANHNKAIEISVLDLVPGDIVSLSAGDMIPADLRLLTSKDLFISQAVLTGEALPVEKYDTPTTQMATDSSAQNHLLDLKNICFMGTNVVSGSATALVVTTGDQTYFGSMARQLTGERPITSFDKGINRISWVLLRFMMIMVPIVFFVNGLHKGDWLQALLFAVAIAVGLTPEMLPMIVTANLARGAVAMSKRKTIVKRLNSIQNFGAMDILCTDKTGTLTQDKIILAHHLDIHGKEDPATLKLAWLNSFHQTGLKNLLDHAVLEYSDKHGVIDDELTSYEKIDEIPFDFVRRRMSVIVRNQKGEQRLICKGAVEEVLALCNRIDHHDVQEGGITELTRELHKQVREITHKLNKDGLRVLAIAHKPVGREDRTYTLEDESGLILSGYIAFLDPPKETAREAIAALAAHGVGVKIITGDNEAVTRKICHDVGLHVEAALLGHAIEALTDEELAQKAEHITIFAKASPLQKSRIIRALQSRGHVVGYMGDGINDAAALRDADVGISVDTGVDIAKEAADIILLEKSLMVLEEGVIEGRRTFGNILKYIKMTASSNFGNVFSVLVASVFLPFLPMLPLHFLIQNLLYDISQISIPWDNMDEDYLKKPRKWEAGGLMRFMLFIGPISSIFDITTYALMWHVFSANTSGAQALFQSGWFVEGLLSQTLIVHMIRTEKVPFFQSTAALPVLMLTLAVMVIGVVLPFSSFGAHVGLVPLPPAYFIWLVAILLSYSVFMQVVKRWYIKRFHQWL